MALLITCLADTFAPRVGVAVVRILRHFGCRVHFDERQTCCGQPLYNNGCRSEAADLARRTIDVFEPYRHVVCPSGSCTAMVRHKFPELLAGDAAYARRAKALASRTWELGIFLTEYLGVQAPPMPARVAGAVAMHMACHHRELQPDAAAERVVCDMAGVNFCRVEHSDQCCGFGGAFSMIYPDISAAMARDKLECLAKSGAELVVCNETGCSMTLEGVARRQAVQPRFVHFAELWAESLGLMNDV